MAKDDQEEAFDKILTGNLQRVLDFLKYAEAKNGALLTIASAWALAVVALLTRDKPIPDNYRLALVLALPFITGAVLAALWSFAPRTSLSRFLGGRRAGPHQPNLLYFGDMARLTAGRMEKDLRASYYPEEGHAATQSYTRDLCVQLAVNSQIVRRKLRFFTVGLAFLALGVVVPLIASAWQHIGMAFTWR
jgi:hypothetical protein